MLGRGRIGRDRVEITRAFTIGGEFDGPEILLQEKQNSSNSNRNIWESEELIEKRIDWNRPPKEGDGAWHNRIELIDRDGEKFNRTFQSIPTTRKLSKKENPSEIIDIAHFHES
ncbi:hypothetical protein Tco_0438722 [Tanacetum coccineum]